MMKSLQPFIEQIIISTINVISAHAKDLFFINFFIVLVGVFVKICGNFSYSFIWLDEEVKLSLKSKLQQHFSFCSLIKKSYY